MTDTLFEGYEAEPAPDDGLSANRKRTLRQRRDVLFGRHPLTGGKTFPDLGTCGECRFRELIEHHRRVYPKCWFPEDRSAEAWEILGPPRHTNGPASDVRAWWPACKDFEPGDTTATRKGWPDAARWKP